METKVAIVLIVLNSVNFCKPECHTGKFLSGHVCVPCPYTCRDGKCDNVTGVCEKCDAGFYGPKCNKRCLANCDECSIDNACNKCSYGYYVSDERICIPCGNNCNRFDCSQTDGTCLHGCVNYMYGALCDSVCPKHCYCGACNQFDGICSEGCEKGFRGPRCLRRNIENDLSMKTSTTKVTDSSVEDETHFEATTEAASPDVDITSKPIATNDNWYVYVVMGVCLLITILILLTCVGYIVHSRKKLSQKSELRSAPSVVYSREYNYIDYSESSNSTSRQNAAYFEPQPDGAYDYIASNSFKQSLTVSNKSCDSDGYLKPTNQNRQYITPVNESDKSPHVNPSYESLKHDENTESAYSGLQKN